PSASTLLPYTTLFRSEAGALQLLWQDMVEDDTALAVLLEAGVPAPAAAQVWRATRQLRSDVRRRGSGPRGRQAMARLVPLLLEQDRKSTRLNSSHVKI